MTCDRVSSKPPVFFVLIAVNVHTEDHRYNDSVVIKDFAVKSNLLL